MSVPILVPVPVCVLVPISSNVSVPVPVTVFVSVPVNVFVPVPLSSPVQSTLPFVSPVHSLFPSPVQSNIQSPFLSSVLSNVQSPFMSTVQSPVQSRFPSPVQPNVQSPFVSSVQSNVQCLSYPLLRPPPVWSRVTERPTFNYGRSGWILSRSGPAIHRPPFGIPAQENPRPRGQRGPRSKGSRIPEDFLGGGITVGAMGLALNRGGGEVVRDAGDEDFWNYVAAASSSEDEDYPPTRARLPLPPGSVLHPAFRSPLDLLEEASLAPNRSPAAPVLKTPSSVRPPPMARSVSAAPQLASAANLLAFPAAAAPAFYSAARLTQLASPATTTLSSPAATALTSPRAADPASTAAAQPRSDTSPALDSTGGSALPTPDSSGKSADPVRVFESLAAAAALRSAVPLATALHSPARATPESAYTAVSSAQVSVISSAALISTQSPSAQVSKTANVPLQNPVEASVESPTVLFIYLFFFFTSDSNFSICIMCKTNIFIVEEPW
ncbi:ice-structuring glycoprotein-like [Astyanax mexicanus]|uniref:Ice-structuring glycoprotein-like n=1 Tax=Astyanax mexicanus TaxID=7994 RepID=A0A8T2MD40_ASTMX|nr:ice-structuring glycoprotein-like [Astyanax mexicanus]